MVGMVPMLMGGSGVAAAPTTWDPTYNSNGLTYSGNNLTATSGDSNDKTARGTSSRSSGLLYYEVKSSTISRSGGIVNSNAISSSFPGSDANGGMLLNSLIYSNGTTSSASGATGLAAGDVVGVAVDFSGGTVTYYLNGSLVGSPKPLPSGPLYPAIDAPRNGASYTANFGATAFAFTPPSGFTAWG